MGKIREIVLFSDYFMIDRSVLKSKGIFDPAINLDTRLFIDPLLLKSSRHDIIRNDAYREYQDYFSKIVSLLSLSLEEGDSDRYYRNTAYRLLPMREIDGTCLGYGTNSISGRGMPQTLKNAIISTAMKIVRAGIKDPNLFTLLPLFNEGIGPDTISDITTYAIRKSLIAFSEKQAEDLGIPLVEKVIEGEKYRVIENPYRHSSYILLLPTDILRNLPVVNKWDDISKAASFNSDLRQRVNKLIAEIFKNRSRNKNVIAARLEDVLKDQDAINDLLSVVKGMTAQPYDLNTDNERLAFIARATEIIAKMSSSPLTVDDTLEGLNRVVETVIDQFQFMIENKGLNELLWKGDKKGRCHERVPQLLFHMIALSYCRANNIDVSPEVDTGTGLIDFKFSSGYAHKIIVELKYSDNPKVISGLSKQLPQYMTSEEATIGHYVVLDVGKMGNKLKLLEKVRNEINMKCHIHCIDANIKPSASKL
ncbi:MAG: hypothetical protein E7115_09220 [Bacteroidales bacterium]|nr:hypothetical protein [Bacteroidales bacterium]MBE6241657.1 hypothetical protein [Bacteroidales bacterium]